MEVLLNDGKKMPEKEYIGLKTRELVNFGFTSMTELEVGRQLKFIKENSIHTSFIGIYIMDDIKEFIDGKDI